MISLFFSSVSHRLAPYFLLALLLVAGCAPVEAPDRTGRFFGPITTPSGSSGRKEAPVTPPKAAPTAPVSAESILPSSAPVAAAQHAQPSTASITSNGTKIALLLPLSGKGANLGQAMINAAQLAVFDVGPQGFEIMTRDTGSNPVKASQAAQEAIQAGAQLLVGPLFAADVAAVKPIVQTSNVNMLALSTDVSLAEPGAYVMGFAPSPQVERVVTYASSQGIKHFAALIPSGPYGELVSSAFEQAVQNVGGTIITSESSTNVAALVAEKDKIEALLLPFGGAELRRIAGQLAAAGFDRNKIKLLGTGLWDDADLAKDQSFLIGGWYPASEPAARASFIETYQKTYNATPPRLATLAYDATALAAVLTRSGQRFDRLAITTPSGFAGLDGIFRFAPNGRVERGLAIHEVTATGSHVVEPAPVSFSRN